MWVCGGMVLFLERKGREYIIHSFIHSIIAYRHKRTMVVSSCDSVHPDQWTNLGKCRLTHSQAQDTALSSYRRLRYAP